MAPVDPPSPAPAPVGIVTGLMDQPWSTMRDGVYDLALGAHDTRSARREAPSRSYVLCSTPRCGSTLLAEALHGTGVLGTPIEYFDPTNAMQACWDRWGCRTLDEYVRALHGWRCSPAGLFGVKLHWFQLQALARVLASSPAVALGVVAPGASLVRVRRRDRRRQATSWARAERTGRWFATPDSEPLPEPPPIAPEEIDRFAERVGAEEASWDRLLEELEVPVPTVVYEDLCDDLAGVVRSVAAFVGGLDDVAVPHPRLVRIAR